LAKAAAFQQLEQLIAEKGDDQRHEFVVVPVADRPQHLKSCLDSLLQLCQTFCYGGYSENRYQKVSVIIADDSKDIENIVKHKAFADEFSKLGSGCAAEMTSSKAVAENPSIPPSSTGFCMARLTSGNTSTYRTSWTK